MPSVPHCKPLALLEMTSPCGSCFYWKPVSHTQNLEPLRWLEWPGSPRGSSNPPQGPLTSLLDMAASGFGSGDCSAPRQMVCLVYNRFHCGPVSQWGGFRKPLKLYLCLFKTHSPPKHESPPARTLALFGMTNAMALRGDRITHDVRLQ